MASAEEVLGVRNGVPPLGFGGVSNLFGVEFAMESIFIPPIRPSVFNFLNSD